MAQGKPAATSDAAAGSGVQVRGVKKSYVTPGGVRVEALRDVSLDAAPGSITALVGPSGSGKSTLLHLIGAMDQPDEGKIISHGLDITELSRAARVHYRRTVGFVFQSFALLPALTARDNVMLPVIPYPSTFNVKARAEELLDSVGLGGRTDALPSQLSGGQRQRVAIARALMNQPQVLIADEPTGNLDSTTGAEVVRLLFDIRDERQMTILIATHDTTLAAQCDRVVHIADGRVHHDPSGDPPALAPPNPAAPAQ